MGLNICLNPRDFINSLLLVGLSKPYLDALLLFNLLFKTISPLQHLRTSRYHHGQKKKKVN